MPTNAQGTNESLIVGFENGFKTLPSPVIGDKLPVTSPNFGPQRNKFTAKALTGVPQPRPVTFGKTGIPGDFGVEMNPESAKPVCKGLFGAPRGPYGGASTNVYWFEYGFASMLSMFAEERYSDVSLYPLTQGMFLGKSTWTFSSEGLWETKFGFEAAKQAGPIPTTTSVTGTITDRTGYDPFSYLLIRIKQGGSVVAYSKMVELTIDRKLGKDLAQDQTTEIATIFSEIPEVSGKLQGLFQDATWLNLALAGTETSLEIWLPAPSGFGALVELPTLKFRPGKRNTNGTGLVTQEIEFDVYGKAGVSQIAGRNRSAYLSTGLALNTLTLIVAPDGGGGQTFTFTAGDTTPDLVAARINATATGMTASVERQAGDTGGVVRIDSNTKGASSSIQVTGGTSNTTLKFDTVLHSGIDNQAVWVTILGPTNA